MTAVTEILEHCKKLISEGNQIDTQGLVHWIEDTLLEMEKKQIIDAHIKGFYSPPFGKSRNGEAKQYYNETFKNTKE
jgi:hypothetical protein